MVHLSTNSIALPTQTWSPDESRRKRRKLFSHRGSSSQQQQRPRKRSNIFTRGLRLTWSFSVVFLLLLLASLIIMTISLYLLNHFMMTSSVHNLAQQDRQLLLLSVYGSVKTYTVGARGLVQSLISEVQWADRVGLNASHPLTTKSVFTILSFMLSQLEFSVASAIWFGTEDNAFTGLSKEIPSNDTTQTSFSTSLDKFIFHRSLGDGKLNHFWMSNTLNVAPRPFLTLFGFYPTLRPWYVPVKQSNDTRWSPILVTQTIPHILAISVASPVFQFTTGELVGVLGATLNLVSLSNYLKSLPSFDTSRIFIVDQNLNLIASNRGNLSAINLPSPDTPLILNAKDSTDVVVRETAILLEKKFPLPFVLPNDTFLELSFTDTGGIERIITMFALRDSFGLNWNIINVFSEKTILSSVLSATRTSVIVTCCLVVAAAIIAILLSGFISVPLYQLSREVLSISQMNFQANDRKIRTLGLFETSVMSISLIHLKNGLRCFISFVPSDVVKFLVRNSTSVRLGVVKRRMTIGFADLTFDNCNVDPKVLVKVLQTMFTELSQIVSDQGGIVDKYISESVMFLFNAPMLVDDHEIRAVRTAQQLVEKIDELNQKNFENLPEQFLSVSIRIGINSDECLVGNVGSKTQFNYTALGDAVNVASRVVSLNSRYGTKVVIGPNTRDAVLDCYVCRWLSCLCVKGKSVPLNVYEPVAERDTATQLILENERMLESLRIALENDNIAFAANIVNVLLQNNPNDKALLELRGRLSDLPHFRTVLELKEK